MTTDDILKGVLYRDGHCTINAVYDEAETNALVNLLRQAESDNDTFRKTDDLFAIRQVLKEVPALSNLVFNNKLKSVINYLFGDGYFVVKSIYFDKPPASNWFVAWHQDLTISVNKKVELGGYGPWTVKQNQFAVQPPLNILQDNFTIRIHLDDADEGNGALKVIPGSHLRNIYRPETINWQVEQPHTCAVAAGGVMIMRPLLMHASGRTTNSKPRKVIHIEFSRTELPEEIRWSERMNVL
ncbi:phytanoyl-CoA dioxygenase [Mucilaginibacter conchicola]|uniref:Phytanoyl-CoA dioxygenase n=1 Tax=Mucilaginibacter conchicola TaxID=2303333 RepID=A0A372P0I6_9SPHI|nr:phytanoyl-CoA dioxygenase family protein [Mucilaginibacter conchicola]RFZ95419.1 phytanoyl-CoA dioxygenase [Mucilaginibacter conchicola]